MNSNVINQNQLRQVFFIILILLMGIVLFMELASFLPALLGGITLYILLHRWMFFLTEKKKWRKGWTAILLMFFSFIVILMPVGLLVNMLSSKVSYAVQHSDELVTALKTVVNNIETRFNVTIASDENINKIGGTITQSLPKILGATFNTLTTIFFMYFILYFMLVNGRYMENTLYEHVPLEDKNVNRLGKEIHMMVVSNAIGIPLIAFAQGLIGLIGYLIIGVKEPFFWFGVTCIAAMLPVIGAALAYIPLAIIFFANNQTGQGIAMLVFGVIIGLSLFGFIGLIFGPLLISLFMLLLKIYSSEFITKQRDINKIMEN